MSTSSLTLISTLITESVTFFGPMHEVGLRGKALGMFYVFYTTYLTNKYDMTFAPFVGVNHHDQSILLGCGLLSCRPGKISLLHMI